MSNTSKDQKIGNPEGSRRAIANVEESLKGQGQGEGGTATEASSLNLNMNNSTNGKFTLTLDCDRLLKPDENRTGIHISLSGEAAAEELQLSSLLAIPILDQIKIKMFHTCGPIPFEEGSCLQTLWDIGAWFVQEFEKIGKTATYEKMDRGRKEDWSEPDATLLVFVDCVGPSDEEARQTLRDELDSLHAAEQAKYEQGKYHGEQQGGEQGGG